MTDPSPAPPLLERLIEQIMFASRWLLAPIHLGLIVVLLVLLIKFAQKAYDLAEHVVTTGGEEAILGALALIDLALTAGLVLMVMFSGYEIFVSRINVGGDKPAWMGQVDFGDLKLKLLASIVAISAIQLLESFMDVAHAPDRVLGWRLGIHLGFVASAVLLAVMDRLMGRH
jgi:uncharacterized protein (TIGR00645 family)